MVLLPGTYPAAAQPTLSQPAPLQPRASSCKSLLLFYSLLLLLLSSEVVPDWGEGNIGGEEEEKADEGKEGYNQGRQVKPWKYDLEYNQRRQVKS